MSKFLLLFNRLETPDTATQQKLGGQWMSGLPAGTALDGFPFAKSGKVVRKDFVIDDSDNRTNFGGAMILHAASMEDAVRIARSSPHVSSFGGEIVVKEIEAPKG